MKKGMQYARQLSDGNGFQRETISTEKIEEMTNKWFELEEMAAGECLGQQVRSKATRYTVVTVKVSSCNKVTI